MIRAAKIRTTAVRKRGRSKARRGSSSLSKLKAQFALRAAREAKILGGDKSYLLSARLDKKLVAAAKKRTGISSDTQLVELALASLAVEDDFGEWLVTQAGKLKADFDADA